MVSDPKAYLRLFPVAERQAVQIVPCFQAEIAKSLTSGKGADSEPAKDALAERQARAAVALIRLGHAEEVWPLLRHSADPRLRSFLVNWLNPLGADPRILAAELVRRRSLESTRGRPADRPLESRLQRTSSFQAATPTGFPAFWRRRCSIKIF
jgi:hypothetical protein